MTAMKATIRDYVIEQAVAHQRESQNADHDESITATQARTKRMKKELQVLNLNEGIDSLSINNEVDTHDSFENIISEVLMEYLHATLATTLVTDDKEAQTSQSAQATIDFVMSLAVQIGGTVLEAMLLQIVQVAGSVLVEGTRAMACAMMGRVAYFQQSIQKRKENSSSASVYNTLAQALLPRLTDKSISVRGAAIQASAVLLDGKWDGNDDEEDEDDSQTNSHDALLDSWLWNLWHDPSVTNRTLAVQTFPASNPQILDHVISRLRDVKEKVRTSAVEILQLRTPLEYFSSEQMAETIRSGLSVRCEATKRATHKLICSTWMKSAKFNTVKLLEAIDVVTYEQEAAQLMEVILLEQQRSRSEDDHHKGPLSPLSPPEIRAFQNSVKEQLLTMDFLSLEYHTVTPELAFLVRMVFADDSTQASVIDELAPDVQVICNHLNYHSMELLKATLDNNGPGQDISCFLSSQFLSIAVKVGLSEEGSRRRLTEMLKDLLSSPAVIPDDLVESAAQALFAAHATTSQVDFVEDIESVVLKLQDATPPQEHAQKSQDMKNIRTLRILSILAVVLENVNPGRSVRALLEKVEESVLQAVSEKCDSSIVRESGVSCLGKMGLYNDEAVVLNKYQPLLLQIAADTAERLELRSQAILAVTDWAMLFPGMMKPDVSETSREESNLALLDILGDLLQSSNLSAACIAAEAPAKLLFAGRVCESTLIARLLVLFFHPRFNQSADSTEGNSTSDWSDFGNQSRVQQLLSLFFFAYCQSSQQSRDLLIDSIESALQGALDSRTSASSKGRRGRTSSYPLIKMIEYIFSVVEESEGMGEQSQGDVTQRSMLEAPTTAEAQRTAVKMALQIAQFLLQSQSDGDGTRGKSLNVTQLRGLCKLLGSLEINDQVPVEGSLSGLLVKLNGVMEEIGMVLTDKTALHGLAPLMESLNAIDFADMASTLDTSTLSDEELENDQKENVDLHRPSSIAGLKGDRPTKRALLSSANALKSL